MNSRLLPLWQNESLCNTIRMKMHVTCTFILLKIKSFSCEMFCMSIRSKERPRHNETVKWKLSLHMSQVAHQVGTYSGFCSMYQLGVFPLHPPPPPPPPTSDGMLVHRRVTCTSQYIICQYLFICLIGNRQ